ncbi:MAG: 23S rRNA (pseudouridine(1915)-N(3))-methyltransferase RlmH [Helicobacteraceae bacterium]
MNALKINIHTVSKQDETASLAAHYAKLVSKYAKLNDVLYMNKEIQKAQTAGKQAAQKAYGELFTRHLKAGAIALDPSGQTLTTKGFAELLSSGGELSFFIGGAFGFSQDFLERCQRRVSLSALTFSHSLARIVLLEQLYRGLSILNNHPYHKE